MGKATISLSTCPAPSEEKFWLEMQHPLFHPVHEKCGIWQWNDYINCIRCVISWLSFSKVLQFTILTKNYVTHSTFNHLFRIGWEFWRWRINMFSATLPKFSLCLALLLCVYLLHTKRRSLWWWQQWAGYREDQKMDRRSSRGGVTSRLASRTLGTMWGRQRPSINITLSSLSAIRDTCKWKTL